MKHIAIVDRKIEHGGTRHSRMKECLEGMGIQVTCIPQVYGDPSRARVGAFDDLRQLTIEALGEKALILLHCGDEQHFVPRVLWPDVGLKIPFLMFTGLDSVPDGVARFLASADASPNHAVLPMRLPSVLPESWSDSSGAIQVKRCVELILSGAEPVDALRLVFGDPRLDGILDGLYDRLAAVSAATQPKALAQLVEDITSDRNTRLDAIYREKRGW